MTGSDRAGTARLTASGVSHHYGGVAALSDVGFDVATGEVHALLGENGAGKSTLVRVLTGALVPDAGKLAIDGRRLRFHSPRDAQAAGIGVVHQDYHLFPDLTVAENVCAVSVHAPSRARIVDRRRMVATAHDLLHELGVDVDPQRRAGGLDAAERKLIEIARALLQRPRFLLLDEPTAALEPRETDRLLGVIARLRERGTGIILVSHRLGEVCRIADRATALRDGRQVDTLPRPELTPTALTHLIVGSTVSELQGPAHHAGPTALEVRGLRLRDGATPIDLHVGERELVAVIGLVGSGVPAVLGAVAGSVPSPSASITVDGRAVRITGPRAARRHGIGFAPEDRKRTGLMLQQSVAANMGLGSLSNWSRGGFTNRSSLRSSAEQAGRVFDIRCRSVDQPVGSLSGGNQQKVLLGRWHLAGVSTLVVQEPSQGVDIGARHEIHKHLVSFAADGGRVLFSSSDMDEVRAIAHRIYVLHAGEVSAVFDNTGSERPSRAAVTEAMTTDARSHAHLPDQETSA
ncbi:sugar ABC transporter ATP-binding protein [Geodermatophilus sp. DF01-2]|uniref:sugar ABC transporter ATP-binding protein n=1 Tax=Geodermatophilus sp. DF01-2 TaxID=2559610 RepID=UPI0010744919|nr:sugar ABC transporter ATP-binding protein [Geodermatophilus sp. DF01_2]TFV59820.1 sugar ABC transporter ATP-binding protein [Geodermatophilus sp. DF01_2]